MPNLTNRIRILKFEGKWLMLFVFVNNQREFVKGTRGKGTGGRQQRCFLNFITIMSVLFLSKGAPLIRTLQATTVPLNLIRHGSHGRPGYWNPDWRASSQAPKTMDERIAAAKKYNLHPADYKPIEGKAAGKMDLSYGDYPDVPCISYDARDPYEAWDYPYHRRNYGEPMHIDFDLYTGDRASTKRHRHSMLYMLLCTSTAVFSIAALYYFTRDVYTFNPMMPKQYPYNDLWVEKGGDPDCMPIRVNYTFETTGVDHRTRARYL
ncbi:putative NADH dehydrogenase [ubiquinone] 1 beta subcomplex subunit 8, mitochondrial [Hypsibius exemplaris]|uniref:NADH dehydrogenase [ubiquinone] 1 beta subcomplex subunit 8, mitochondrial n=1 Tax=Hypsibius exemplaris TaxID=2072580 RepID=A0A1W0XBS1_HYPEX|nr:putative NADH dehydrogenase [ubiquinone] 1 beta subcomplex subunit 8, mitochondrial [Hypsibius exemplaris]